MLQTIILITQGTALVIYNLTIFLITIFTILSFFSISPSNTYHPIFNNFLGSLLFVLYITLPTFTIFFILPLSALFIYHQNNTTNNHPELIFWNHLLNNTELLINVYTQTITPNIQQPSTNNVATLLFLSFIASTLSLIFISNPLIHTTLLIIYSCILALVSSVTLIFYATLISPQTSVINPKDNNFQITSSHSPSPEEEFVSFLNLYSSNNTLNATVEELFYEENLQIGNFFLAFPIFYKTNSPENLNLSSTQELSQLWHTIRWESTFSNQIGSGTDWWTTENPQNNISPPDSVHSIHIPVIPIYSNNLFQALENQNFPTFDPFDLNTNWTPYQVLTSSKRWDLTNINEERPNEIEEED